MFCTGGHRSPVHVNMDIHYFCSRPRWRVSTFIYQFIYNMHNTSTYYIVLILDNILQKNQILDFIVTKFNTTFITINISFLNCLSDRDIFCQYVFCNEPNMIFTTYWTRSSPLTAQHGLLQSIFKLWNFLVVIEWNYFRFE